MVEFRNGPCFPPRHSSELTIANGQNGTAGRRYMGALPAAGQWAKLEVPASQIGLEGSSLKGMRFSLYGGRDTFDATTKGAPGAGTGTNTGSTNVVNPPTST